MIKTFSNRYRWLFSYLEFTLWRYWTLLFVIIATCAESKVRVELAPLTNLPSIEQSSWRQLVSNPINNQQYYLAQNSGTIYLIDGDNEKPKVLLDFSSFVPEQEFIALTAFALHPAFNLKDQSGFTAFYTGHIEHHRKESKTARLPKKLNVKAADYDLVVTEWRLKNNQFSQVDANSKRELLRITAPDSAMNISSLQFDPYAKAWHKNYGYLFIALSSLKQNGESPLFSGSLLRVNPAKFGLRQYTVPEDNPFIEHDDIDNEVVVLGAGEIGNIYWRKSQNNGLYIQHTINNQSLTFFSPLGSDWRGKQPDNLWSADTQGEVDSGLFYQGRQTAQFRGNFLQLNFSTETERWQLLTISGFSEQALDKTMLWQFGRNDFSEQERLQIFLTDTYEPLIVAPELGGIYRLLFIEDNTDLNTNNEINSDVSAIESKLNLLPLFLMFIFVASLAAVYYQYVYKRKQTKRLLKRQYTKMSLSEDKKHVLLYRLRHKKPSVEINISDIVESQIWFNEELINRINDNSNHGFDEVKQTDVQAIFDREHREKMVPHKVRNIQILIQTADKADYFICLYLRKGDHRFSKMSYRSSLEAIYDWCWFIAAQLNPDETPKRKVKAKLEHHESAKKPVKTVVKVSKPAKEIKQVEVTESPIDKVESLQKDQKATEHSFIDALDKLVSLRQQNLLTEQEFEQAKAKLLRTSN